MNRSIINKTDKQMGIDRYKYFYMLLMFLWCAYTAPFLKPFDSNYLLTSAFYIIVYLLYFCKYCIGESKKALFVPLGIMLLWYVSQCLKVGYLTNIDFRLVYSVVLCHVSFYLYRGREFFWYLEKVLIHLTILSLIVWGLGMFFTAPMQRLVNGISVWTNGNTTYGNMIFVALGNQWTNGILRNIGFTWEAGRFSSFLVLGLFNNMLIHRFRIKGNKPLYIYLIGLLTTFSTTGIGAALGVLLLYAYNKSIKIKATLIVLCVLMFPSIFALDFVGDKILNNIDVEREIWNMEYSFNVYETAKITPQRFTGLYLDVQNWLHDFWFGYNLNENSYVEKIMFGGNPVWLSNGVIQIFSKYGLFVGLFFYFQLFKSSFRLSEDLNYKGKYIFSFIFIVISVSYDFWSSAIMLHYILYDLYSRKGYKKPGRYTINHKYGYEWEK